MATIAVEELKAWLLTVRQGGVRLDSFSASQKVTTDLREESDNTDHKLIERSPTTFMDSRKECGLHTEALILAIEAAQRAGMATEAGHRLTELGLHTKNSMYRQA